MHPVAWVIWVGAVTVALWQTRNPVYVLTLLAGILLTQLALLRASPIPSVDTGQPRISFRLSLLIVPFSALFNALWTRAGDTVLLRLPDSLPLIGGAITLEALAFGALNGLVLLALLHAFNTLNLALSVRDMITLIPAAFYDIAVVLSVALTYVPVTLRQAMAIREAQAVRGQPLKRLSDWLPVLTALLVGGLERAFALAEAMTARGFASSAAAQPLWRMVTLLGLLLCCAGWLLRGFVRESGIGLSIAALSLLIIALALWRIGRAGIRRTRYRISAWGFRDNAMIAAAAGVLITALVPVVPGRSSLFYDPYPVLLLPPIAWPIMAGLLLIALPALLAWRHTPSGAPDDVS
jgi:energy-coupling factor transport system permease protein